MLSTPTMQAVSKDIKKQERGDGLIGKYFYQIRDVKRWKVTKKDMALKELMRLTRLKGCKFKALAINKSMTDKWNEDVESIEDKNQLMQTENVTIVTCPHLSNAEAYGFATVEEATRFISLVNRLIALSVSKRDAISMSYNHIEKLGIF